MGDADGEIQGLRRVVGRAKRLSEQAAIARRHRDTTLAGRVYDELLNKLLPQAEELAGKAVHHKAYAHFAYGVALRALRMHGDATRELRQALAIDRGLADAWIELALAFDDVTAYGDAEAAAREAVRLAPQSEEAWTTLSIVLRGRGGTKEEEAQLAMGHALRLSRPDPTASSDSNPRDCSVRLEACRAYARMVNRLDYSLIEPWLADNLHYVDQRVEEEMHSKTEYGDYVCAKLAAIRAAGKPTFGEIAYFDGPNAGPCVVVAQDNRENLICSVRIDVRGDKIIRIGMILNPPPSSCERTGEYPT